MTGNAHLNKQAAGQIFRYIKNRKEYAFYIMLRRYSPKGSIRAFKSRRVEIAKTFGCCEKTLRIWISRLEKIGWVWYEGKRLRIKSQKKIMKGSGLKCKQCWIIPFYDYKKTLSLLDSFCLNQNKQQQEYRIEKNKEVNRPYNDAHCYQDYFEKNYVPYGTRAVVKKIVDFAFLGREKRVTLSRNGMARQFVLCSAAGAAYRFKKMKEYGFATESASKLMITEEGDAALKWMDDKNLCSTRLSPSFWWDKRRRAKTPCSLFESPKEYRGPNIYKKDNYYMVVRANQIELTIPVINPFIKPTNTINTSIIT